jgi:hypothetical protein
MVQMIAGRANFMVGDGETRVAEGGWRKRLWYYYLEKNGKNMSFWGPTRFAPG